MGLSFLPTTTVVKPKSWYVSFHLTYLMLYYSFSPWLEASCCLYHHLTGKVNCLIYIYCIGDARSKCVNAAQF